MNESYNTLKPDNWAPPKQASLKEYLLSREFWVTIGVLFGFAFISLIFIFYIFIPILTNHNESAAVPNVTSQLTQNKFIRIEEAIKKLEEAGFKPEVSDSHYHADVPPLVVLKQEPSPYSLIKPGRTVLLVINKQSPPLVKIPDILENEIEQAKRALENWGLKVGRISTTAGDGLNLVVGMAYRGRNLSFGDAVPEGAAIDLVITTGYGISKVKLPDVVGLYVEEAISELNKVGLIANIQYNNKDDADPGRVVQQNPKASQVDSIAHSSSVIIIISGRNRLQVSEGVIQDEEDDRKENKKETKTDAEQEQKAQPKTESKKNLKPEKENKPEKPEKTKPDNLKPNKPKQNKQD